MHPNTYGHCDGCRGSCLYITDSYLPCLEEGLRADFRAQQKADNRVRKQKQKYYGYRGVKPSWIGQQYYSITLVSEETVTWEKSREGKRSQQTVLLEHEHPKSFDKLLHNDTMYAHCLSPAIVELAVAEVNRGSVKPQRETMKPYTCDHTEVTTIEAPIALAHIPYGMPASLPAELKDARLKLRIRTWTKRDNFDQKEVYVSGPDRRHHHGKRRVRERHLQKWFEHDIERDARSRQVIAHDNAREIRAAENGEDEADTVWNLEDELRHRPWDGCAYCIGGSRDHVRWTGEVRVCCNADHVDRCVSDAAFSHWLSGIPEAAVSGSEHDVVQEDGFEEGELWLEMERSLHSSDTVIVCADGDAQSMISDFDNMSDLAGEIAEIEWDVLSEDSTSCVHLSSIALSYCASDRRSIL